MAASSKPKAPGVGVKVTTKAGVGVKPLDKTIYRPVG